MSPRPPFISPRLGSDRLTPMRLYKGILLRKARIDMPSTLAAWVRFPLRQASVSQTRPHSTAAMVWPTSFRTRSISSGVRPAERRKSFATGGAFWRRTSGITASRKDRASSLKPSNRDAAPLPNHQRAPNAVNEFLRHPSESDAAASQSSTGRAALKSAARGIVGSCGNAYPRRCISRPFHRLEPENLTN